MKVFLLIVFIGSICGTSYTPSIIQRNLTGHDVLDPGSYEPYVVQFNKDDNELYEQHISNRYAWNFLEKNIPLFDCPDKEFEKVYYFRWWVYRKHIKKIEANTTLSRRNVTLNYVITEFVPSISWAGTFNTISAAGAHHIRGSTSQQEACSLFFFALIRDQMARILSCHLRLRCYVCNFNVLVEREGIFPNSMKSEL